MTGINTILVLGPHTDDGELGCGGTIAKFLRLSKQVHYAAFSIAEESVPDGLPKDVLLHEIRAAADAFGLPQEQLHVFRYPVRNFPQYRQEILEDLVKLRTQIKPDLVLLPARSDVHQDHQTISAEGIRAFKYTRILGYELPWNQLETVNNVSVILQPEDVEAKIQAIRCYKSQVAAGRHYTDPEFIRGMARLRGVQVAADFAEAFEGIRWIID